jgi:hypothetical protein
MNIKKEEWPAFAAFITMESTHQYSSFIEDGTYTKCPYSTMERAYVAFTVYRQTHSYSETKKYWDVDVALEGSEEVYEDSSYENSYWDEVELCYEQQYPEWEWPDEADNYVANRKKQLIRIAHELADRHPHLPLDDGKESWVGLVWPFFDMYELNIEEKVMFTDEYYEHQYINEYLNNINFNNVAL